MHRRGERRATLEDSLASPQNPKLQVSGGSSNSLLTLRTREKEATATQPYALMFVAT